MMDMLVNIDVDDIERAESFYCSLFKLEVGRRFGADGVELIGSSSTIYLLKKAAGTQASRHTAQHRDYARHWCPIHLDFVVEDIEAAVARASTLGATLEHAVSVQPWGKLALLSDPFGHGFCFVEFVGLGYDEIATSARRRSAG